MAIFFTIAGTNHHYGSDFMEKDMKVFLEKEPDNDHDREAMRRWAIQIAGTVKVVSPPELVEEIRETIRKMAAEYQV